MITPEQDAIITAIINSVYDNAMTPDQYKKMQEEKDRQFFGAVEEIEGKVLSPFEVQQFGRIEQREGRANEEFVVWRGRPILHFKWSPRTGSMKTLALYK